MHKLLDAFDTYAEKRNDLAEILSDNNIPLDRLKELDAAVLNFAKAASR